MKELNVELVQKEAAKAGDTNKVYELVAKLADVPEKTTTGVVTFESSLATQPKVEVPVSIYIFTPPQSAVPRAQSAVTPAQSAVTPAQVSPNKTLASPQSAQNK